MWRDGSKLVNGSVDEPGLRASKTFRIRYCPSLWSLINRTFSAKFSQLEYFVYRYDEEENVQDFPDPRNLFGLYWVPINTYIYISNFFFTWSARISVWLYKFCALLFLDFPRPSLLPFIFALGKENVFVLASFCCVANLAIWMPDTLGHERCILIILFCVVFFLPPSPLLVFLIWPRGEWDLSKFSIPRAAKSNRSWLDKLSSLRQLALLLLLFGLLIGNLHNYRKACRPTIACGTYRPLATTSAPFRRTEIRNHPDHSNSELISRSHQPTCCDTAKQTNGEKRGRVR